MSDKVLVSVEPTDELLHSMAIRYDHGLAIPGYYDTIPIQCGPSHKERYDQTITIMRQLHEEVVGSGFYKQEDAPEPADCSRSHPHENMGEICKLKTQIAKLQNKIAAMKPVSAEPVAFMLPFGDLYTHPPAQQWIKCSERLPNLIGSCLALSGTTIYFAFYNSDGKWAHENNFLTSVTHWMPLPAPPAEG